MNYCKLPAGVQDILPRECRALNDLKTRLQNKFTACGFEPVLSAALEYYDSYSRIRNAVPQEQMFKLTDNDGKLLVLRPDMTLSISRIAATRRIDRARLCYFADKWDLSGGGQFSSREIFQAGVECLGEQGAFSDAQAIAFAVECLKEAGLKDFIIDVGHVGYFKGIAEECGLSAENAERLRAYVDAKDGLNAERLLESVGAGKGLRNAILALPTLFGGAEILDRAADTTENSVSRAAIAHLKQVSALLNEMGYEKCVCFDLGTVKRLSYYSGVVFSGLVKGLGVPVLSGGRYDLLADDFGKHIPAVGFAMGLKRILVALERQGMLPEEEKPLAVVCAKGAEGRGYRRFLSLAASGKRVFLSPECGEEAAEKLRAEGYTVLCEEGEE